MSSAAKSKKEESSTMVMVRLAATLCAICGVCALLLGLVNAGTADRIAQVKEEKKNAAMAAVLPAEGYDPMVYGAEGAADETIREVYRAGDAGYVFQVAPSGSFGGGLVIMVGVTSGLTVSGVEIVESSETSGLGANARKPAFREQFAGQSGEVKVTKDGGSIDALTGATITSRAVCAGVSSALAAAAALD